MNILLLASGLVGFTCIVLKIWQDVTGFLVMYDPSSYPLFYIKQSYNGDDVAVDDDCMDSFEGEVCKGLSSQPGACEATPLWMVQNCPAACGYCDLRSSRKRCDGIALESLDAQEYTSGDVNAMFEKIESKYAHLGVEVISRNPWLVTFNNFTSDEEAETLISLTEHEMHRSLGQASSCYEDNAKAKICGIEKGVVTMDRTSSNSWCIHEECRENALVKRVNGRIENVTGISSQNYEHFQTLRCKPTEECVLHHDVYSSKDNIQTSGIRVFTLFLCLSDVSQGGETYFPYTNSTIKPKKGKAALWSNVYNHNPSTGDPRAVHSALPVIQGTKYAANVWIHSRECQNSSNWGCANYKYSLHHRVEKLKRRTSGSSNGLFSGLSYFSRAIALCCLEEFNEVLWSIRTAIIFEKYSFGFILRWAGLYRYFM